MFSSITLLRNQVLGSYLRSLVNVGKGLTRIVQPTRNVHQTASRFPKSSSILMNFASHYNSTVSSCIFTKCTSLLVNPIVASFRGIASIPFYRPEKNESSEKLYRSHTRLPPKRKKKRRPLDGKPQMKGVVLKTVIKNPKKPNSGNRKCVLLRLSNGKVALARVPGIGHNLQEHHVVLVECGRTKDVPGLNLKVIRGKYDCAQVVKGVQK